MLGKHVYSRLHVKALWEVKLFWTPSEWWRTRKICQKGHGWERCVVWVGDWHWWMRGGNEINGVYFTPEKYLMQLPWWLMVYRQPSQLWELGAIWNYFIYIISGDEEVLKCFILQEYIPLVSLTWKSTNTTYAWQLSQKWAMYMCKIHFY